MASNDPRAFFGTGNPPPGGMPGAAMGEAGTQGTGQITAPDPVSGGGSSGGTGAGKSFDIDNMLRTYLPGLTDPAQIAAVKQALHQMAGAEGSGGAYHSAIDALVQKYPQQLQGMTPMGKAFGTSQPGQLNADVMKGLTDWTNAYQKPLVEAMGRDTSQVMDALKGLAPKLPAGYQNLIKTQQPGLQNMAGEISTMLAQAQPGAIANAYSQYNAGGTASPTAANLFSSLTAPKTP